MPYVIKKALEMREHIKCKILAGGDRAHVQLIGNTSNPSSHSVDQVARNHSHGEATELGLVSTSVVVLNAPTRLTYFYLEDSILASFVLRMLPESAVKATKVNQVERNHGEAILSLIMLCCCNS